MVRAGIQGWFDWRWIVKSIAKRLRGSLGCDAVHSLSADDRNICESQMWEAANELERMQAVIDKQESEIKSHYQNECDPYADLIEANRDAMLKIHEEAVKRIGKVLIGGGDRHDAEKLIYIGKVLHALSVFHQMHCETWKGWPE
jgi:hypothetical protein